MAKISRLLGSTVKAAITAQAGFHAKRIPAVSSLSEHIPARYNSTQACLDNVTSGEDNKGFRGHDMLAPFTAGWQSTDVDPLIIEKSEGSHVYDVQGRKYLDTLAGLWCTALGGNEPRLVDAATKQLNTLPFYHSFWNRTTKPSLDLAKELLDMFTAKKMAKAFFTNSGSEANDTQVKLVWYYNNALGSYSLVLQQLHSSGCGCLCLHVTSTKLQSFLCCFGSKSNHCLMNNFKHKNDC